MIIRRPRAPIFRRRAASAIASRASSVNRSLTFSYSKSLWYWRVIALRGCVRIWTSAGLVELVERADDRQPADELGDQAVLDQVLGLELLERHADVARR